MGKHAIDDLAVIISASTEQLAGDLRAAVRMFDGFRKDVERQKAVGPAADTSGIKTIGAGIRGITGMAKDAAASVASIAAKTAVATATFGAMQAGAMAVGTGFQHVKDSVNLAADLEQNTLAFEVMLKSADGAKKILADIRQFAATTPFNTKELTQAAQMLVAYGTAADQVVPTIKMLGDVSAAFGKRLPVTDLTYLYGTLQAQGRAYTKDINQFTNRGIDVLPQLAAELKVSTAEVMKLVEEGRVGFPEVVKAFKAMTAEGGRFHDMTRRQGQTFAGLREAAFDAFDLLKTKFGQVVIDEFGLKRAAKDFDAWAKDVTAHVDRVRPAVKFVGDLVKGVVQGTYELAKAGGQIAAINFEQAGAAWPGVKAAAESVRRMVADAQNFKFDKREVVKFGIALGESVITAVNWAIEAATGFGKFVWENIATPIIEAAKAITAAVNAVKGMKNLAADAAGDPVKFAALQAAAMQMMFGGAGKPADPLRINQPGGIDVPPKRGEIDELKNLYGAAQSRVVFADPAKDSAKIARDLIEQHNIRNRFEGDDKQRHNALMGWDADFPLKLKAPVAPPAPAQAAGFKFDAAALRASGANILAQLDAEDAAEKAKKLAAETQAAADGMAAFKAAIRDSGVAGAMHNAAMAAGRFEGTLSALNPGFRQFWERGFDAAARVGKVRDFTGPDAVITSFANNVKNELDPMRALKIEKADLDKALGFGLITRDMRDAAWSKRVQNLAGQLGVGGDVQLADAAVVGSQEDARLLARHAAGTGAQRTDDLLLRIEQGIERSNKILAAMSRSGLRLLGIEF
jgi:hypothetical protein